MCAARFHLVRILQSYFDAQARNPAQGIARHHPPARRRRDSQFELEDRRANARYTMNFPWLGMHSCRYGEPSLRGISTPRFINALTTIL
ncbi:hypothetical protein X948_5202 [Burkholderia pseudomallei MSHR5608]|nr:hypothetical protein X948_5202 [Burkholderia pseudomallei MSHR5608]